MPRRQTPEQQQIVARVMGEFKEGELVAAGDKTVTDPKQAIAIALREAGASDRETPETNRRNLRRTKVGIGTATRADLYAEARRRGVPGRSKMTKAEFERALKA